MTDKLVAFCGGEDIAEALVERDGRVIFGVDFESDFLSPCSSSGCMEQEHKEFSETRPSHPRVHCDTQTRDVVALIPPTKESISYDFRPFHQDVVSVKTGIVAELDCLVVR